ncbi:TetR/AcrR family transcriptional regulator [Microbacterium sp. MPKO10]|uniref:TetR/AcrR family transcriptional regulator n=1 Tax=Microbacterium sp. MPKO10 TaxID=2989818 RepID=UPI002235E1B5|nr:TetR/AcrR family transcriptional regulator [Microbacterium sp. MPKO10]MCW4457148.1 TetR/AcrR family transcriptional regulator [Microbacterium sp. MPKO10]
MSERRPQRADAKRNLDALVEAAKSCFAESGVDAPTRTIAEAAGVGVGTLYRHFPQRSDLVTAVFRHEVDACADAAPVLAEELEPDEALVTWLRRYTDFLGTKKGLGKALHSGDPAFDALPNYFVDRLVPALTSLLTTAEAAGSIRPGVNAKELLYAVASLSAPVDSENSAPGTDMVGLLIDGLRYAPQR